MKKFLFVLTITFAFMACDPVDLPKKDSKALDAVTYEALAQLGKDRADVEKTLTSLGFIPVEVEYTYTSVPDPSPCKFANAPASRKDVLPWDYSEQHYVYGVTLSDTHIKDEDLWQMMASSVAKGNTCINLSVSFINMHLYYSYAQFYLPITKNVNYAYASVSDEMYKQLATTNTPSWQGDATVAKKTTNFTDHAKFSSFVISAQDIQALEEADCSEFEYYLLWNYPDDETQAAMLEEGFEASFVTGYSLISYMNLANQ